MTTWHKLFISGIILFFGRSEPDISFFQAICTLYLTLFCRRFVHDISFCVFRRSESDISLRFGGDLNKISNLVFAGDLNPISHFVFLGDLYTIFGTSKVKSPSKSILKKSTSSDELVTI